MDKKWWSFTKNGKLFRNVNTGKVLLEKQYHDLLTKGHVGDFEIIRDDLPAVKEHHAEDFEVIELMTFQEFAEEVLRLVKEAEQSGAITMSERDALCFIDEGGYYGDEPVIRMLYYPRANHQVKLVSGVFPIGPIINVEEGWYSPGPDVRIKKCLARYRQVIGFLKLGEDEAKKGVYQEVREDYSNMISCIKDYLDDLAEDEDQIRKRFITNKLREVKQGHSWIFEDPQGIQIHVYYDTVSDRETYEKYVILVSGDLTMYSDNKEKIASYIDKLLGDELSTIFSIYTASEASERWGLSSNTVTQWCNRGKFYPWEARKSGNTWLVTREAMIRVTGRKSSRSLSIIKDEIEKGYIKPYGSNPVS